MYKALYRKYRPDRFSRIVGQKHIVQTLENAIEQSMVGHAYLFHGPRGTGKTSIAKIFAQAVNCENPTAQEKPCHECETCRLIDEGSVSDIIELDAASNNGVDEMRQIREFARYAPTSVKKKVYIIDEVHMLTTAAFNALLKTLEEPPAHVLFILATTEIHKIPLTILSRCQRFDFKKVSPSEMVECLTPIMEQEGVKITDDALDYLTDYADGGMRDALSVLDQAIAYSNNEEITLQNVLDVIGSVGDDVYMQIVQDIINKDSHRILDILQTVIDSGKNVQLFVEDFIKYLLKEIETNLTSEQMFPTPVLFSILKHTNELATNMKHAYMPHIALQALFLELTYDFERKEADAPRQVIANDAVAAVPMTPAMPREDAVIASPVIEEVEVAAPVSDVVEPENVVAPTLPVVEEVNMEEQVTREALDISNQLDTTNETLTEEVKQAEELLGEEITEPEVAVQPEEEKEELLDLFSYDPIDDDVIMEDEDHEEIDLVFNFEEQQEVVLDAGNAEIQEAQSMSSTTDQSALDSSLEAQYLMKEPTHDEPVETEEIEATPDATPVAVSEAPTFDEGLPIPSNEEKEILEDDEKRLEDERIRKEKTSVQIQRVMTEVVIYPEYNELEKLKRRWQSIQFNPSNAVITMLVDMEPKIATKNELVLSSYSRSLANQLMLPQNTQVASNFISELMDNEYSLIITDEASWLKEREVFAANYKANKIGEETLEELASDEKTLEEEAEALGYEYATLFEEETFEEVSEIVSSAQELFGADIVKVEE